MIACGCYPNPEDHEDGCPVRLGKAERVEYGCQFTDWTFDVGIEKWDVKYEDTGTGEHGLSEARRMVEDTRAWQPRQNLPVDAVVVFRPVSEWAVLPDEEG